MTEPVPGDNEQTPALPDQFAIIADHLVVNVGHCTCDGPFETYGHRPECGYEPIMTLDQLAAVLSQAGRTVLELPEPDGTSYEGDPIWSAHVDAEETIFACVEHGEAVVESPFDGPWSAVTAELFGLRLIAAARTARRLASESSGDGEQGE